jgi:peptide/nickel transport system substrate-binding protein
MLKDFVPGDHATMVRNPHYWETGYPYLDAVKFLYLPQATTQVAAVQSGQADFITVLTAPQLGPLANDSSVTVSTLAATAFLNMRMRADRKPFSDPRVRNAFKYIVDRKAVDQILVNGLSPLGNDTPLGPGFGQWYTNIGTRPTDPAKAQALLGAAGYTKAKPLSVKLYAANAAGALQFATAFQQMAGNVNNVAISIVSDTLTTYYTYWLDVDFAITSWGARTVPQEILDLLYRKKAVWNEGHYYNDKLEALLTAAGQELDTTKRKSLYKQIELLISGDGPSIIPSYNVFTLPLRKRVQGFIPLPDTFHYYKTAWIAS